MRGSRSGRVTSTISGSRVAGEARMKAAAVIAPTMHAPPSARNAGFVPPRRGRTTAPSAPPIGMAVCRIPSARPSSSEGNQPMIARPLAAFTLAPRAPAAASAPTSGPKEVVAAAPARAAPAPTRPTTMTQRSSNRSAASPHGRSVTSMPIPIAARTTPVSPSDSAYSDRIAGASAGSPTEAVAKLACATVPAARITHR